MMASNRKHLERFAPGDRIDLEKIIIRDTNLEGSESSLLRSSL